MFGWMKKIKKEKKEDEVFVMTPDDVTEEEPETLKEENPEGWVDVQVKETRKKKENVEPKKNDTESQADADLGKLNLRKHVIAKRREYLAERKKYEKEYLARLKKPQKAKPKKKKSLPRKR